MASGVVWIDLQCLAIVTDCFGPPFLSSERIAQCGISNCCIWPAGQRRTVITDCFDGLVSEQGIPKDDVCPEIGGVSFLHLFQERRRIATGGSTDLSLIKESFAVLGASNDV